MSKHINEWLNAYMDGELRDSRLKQVEAHLAVCPDCRAELESLAGLSSLLHEAPRPQFLPAEQFISQVNLRLPHRQVMTTRSQAFEIGWWMVPVALLAAWIFINTSFFLRDLISVAGTLGYVNSVSDWLIFGSTAEAYWTATLGQFGVLSGESLDLVAAAESVTRSSLPQISLQVAIALLYLGWIAVWWTRHTRQEHGRSTN
ncbi:MAG TPA: zf-HC2 domain-containing protein [Anaerolineales bacterium]|nr:zf-HC2 domain-containing protein [Anaerolineales bacterium]